MPESLVAYPEIVVTMPTDTWDNIVDAISVGMSDLQDKGVVSYQTYQDLIADLTSGDRNHFLEVATRLVKFE